MSVPFFPAFYISLFSRGFLINVHLLPESIYFAANNVVIHTSPHAAHHTTTLLNLPNPPLNLCCLAIPTFPDAPARVLIASFPCVAHALGNGSVFRVTHTKIRFIRSPRQCCQICLFLTF